jgi:hypothetical protein
VSSQGVLGPAPFDRLGELSRDGPENVERRVPEPPPGVHADDAHDPILVDDHRGSRERDEPLASPGLAKVRIRGHVVRQVRATGGGDPTDAGLAHADAGGRAVERRALPRAPLELQHVRVGRDRPDARRRDVEMAHQRFRRRLEDGADRSGPDEDGAGVGGQGRQPQTFVGLGAAEETAQKPGARGARDAGAVIALYRSSAPVAVKFRREKDFRRRRSGYNPGGGERRRGRRRHRP